MELQILLFTIIPQFVFHLRYSATFNTLSKEAELSKSVKFGTTKNFKTFYSPMLSNHN